MTNIAVPTIVSLPFWLTLLLIEVYRGERARDRKDLKWRARIADQQTKLGLVEAELRQLARRKR
ncbi:MAG: hypothetical protein AB8I08_10155 [Sandaracinaceae bacterium]